MMSIDYRIVNAHCLALRTENMEWRALTTKWWMHNFWHPRLRILKWRALTTNGQHKWLTATTRELLTNWLINWRNHWKKHHWRSLKMQQHVNQLQLHQWNSTNDWISTSSFTSETFWYTKFWQKTSFSKLLWRKYTIAKLPGKESSNSQDWQRNSNFHTRDKENSFSPVLWKNSNSSKNTQTSNCQNHKTVSSVAKELHLLKTLKYL